jgi:hypothetical protein
MKKGGLSSSQVGGSDSKQPVRTLMQVSLSDFTSQQMAMAGTRDHTPKTASRESRVSQSF